MATDKPNSAPLPGGAFVACLRVVSDIETNPLAARLSDGLTGRGAFLERGRSDKNARGDDRQAHAAAPAGLLFGTYSLCVGDGAVTEHGSLARYFGRGHSL